jgi:hypothetical protein
MRNGIIYLQPSSKTVKGWLVDTEPVIPAPPDGRNLGAAILEALALSTTGIPHPENLNDPNAAAIVKAAGVKTYQAFIRGAKCVSIERQGDQLVVTPTRNGGWGKAFLFLRETVTCEADATRAGAVLLQAFDACTT